MDRAAFDEIFNQYAGPVHLYIQKRLGDTEEVDDILQEVFMRIWLKRHSIAIHSSFRNYLYTVVQNCINDHLRAVRRKRYALTAEPQERVEERPQPDEQVHYKQVYHIWKSAMNRLPGQMRRIYAMKNEEQLSIKEIAAELELSEQTVKNQLNTAGQRIVKLLRQVQFLFF